MRAFTCAAIMLVTVAASAPFTEMAFAQAGSTGGTLGNTNKSISGDRGGDVEQPHKKARTNSSREAISPAGHLKLKQFSNPTYQGMRVVNCLRWGPQECGLPAATAWCRTKGFSTATDYKIENYHPGVFIDPQSSVRVCDLGLCDAFSQISCE
jgi:hypothetical protein